MYIKKLPVNLGRQIGTAGHCKANYESKVYSGEQQEVLKEIMVPHGSLSLSWEIIFSCNLENI